ncbi:MAG: hypothetical protein B6I38_01115 [Anaerolineaceae bacterium 4572_5.1]|nr:MAG: hypothetical protein B6I38_01115 [Anaerolineaceae bacterium 4572_5.1]
MKRLIPFILLFSFLLSACGAIETAPTTPTVSPEDIRATADAMVYDMLTQTQAALPTNTMIPPTNTPLPPATATITLIPTFGALDGSPTVSAIATFPTAALVVPTTSSTGYACTKQPLTGWSSPSVQLSVTNNVKNSTANVFLCITTDQGEAGYINIPLVKSNSASVPYGCYSATAWVDGKKDFNATTTFCIKSPGNVQLIINENRIDLQAGCAPNC